MRSFFVAGLLLVAIAFAVSCSHQMDTKWLVVISLTIVSVWIQMEIWRSPVKVDNTDRVIRDIEIRKRQGAYATSYAFSMLLSLIVMFMTMYIYSFHSPFALLLGASVTSFIPGIVAKYLDYRTRDG